MFRPYMAISRYYYFMFIKTNFHKATHFSNNNNNNNNNNSLITETTWDSQQNSCHNCYTTKTAAAICPVSKTIYGIQNVKEGIKLK